MRVNMRSCMFVEQVGWCVDGCCCVKGSRELEKDWIRSYVIKKSASRSVGGAKKKKKSLAQTGKEG